MIGFWILAAVMTLVVIGILAAPLFETRKAKDESGFALNVYRDQLAEIERDKGRGVLPEDQAKAAQLEIQRRILALAGTPAVQPGRARHRRLIALVAIPLPLFGVGLYLAVGAPQLPDRPFAEERQVALSATPEFVASRAKAMRDPDNPDAWLAFARTALRQHRIEDSVEAFRRAVDLGKSDPEVYVDYGRALVLFHDGEVEDDARQILEKALKLDPNEHMALFLLALRKAQLGNVDGALDDWVKLEKNAESDGSFRAMLAKSIDKAARQLGKDPAKLLGETIIQR